jgi:hypothetical protein
VRCLAPYEPRMNHQIELREEAVTCLLLTPEEAAELRRLDMDVQPECDETTTLLNGGAGGMMGESKPYQISPGSKVGCFRLTTGERRVVRIIPKVEIGMCLRCSGPLTASIRDQVPCRFVQRA